MNFLGILEPALAVIIVSIVGVFGGIESVETYEDVTVVNLTIETGWSIGGIICSSKAVPDNRAHEYGHVLQQRKYGDMYLPISVLTSMIGNGIFLLTYKTDYRVAYYAFGLETEADMLGGVNDRSMQCF